MRTSSIRGRQGLSLAVYAPGLSTFSSSSPQIEDGGVMISCLKRMK